MDLRTMRRAGAALCACLLAAALCGFALPAPEEWLARDPDFSLTRPFGQAEEEPDEHIITIIPSPEEEALPREDGILLPGEPCPLPEDPLTAVFLQ